MISHDDMSRYVMCFYVLFLCFASFRLFVPSPHFTSLHLTPLHLTSLHLTPLHLTSPHPSSPHLTLPHLTSPHFFSSPLACSLSFPLISDVALIKYVVSMVPALIVRDTACLCVGWMEGYSALLPVC